jgi:hypothetical protein
MTRFRLGSASAAGGAAFKERSVIAQPPQLISRAHCSPQSRYKLLRLKRASGVIASTQRICFHAAAKTYLRR